MIDEDLDGVGACEPHSVDWDFNAGACRSSLSDHVGMASDLEGCGVLCSELYGANLKAIDLDSNKAREKFRFSIELSDATGSQQAWIGGTAAETLLGCTPAAFARADFAELDALKASLFL